MFQIKISLHALKKEKKISDNFGRHASQEGKRNHVFYIYKHFSSSKFIIIVKRFNAKTTHNTNNIIKIRMKEEPHKIIPENNNKKHE